METCTAIQSRRENQLIVEYSNIPVDMDGLNSIGFWSSSLNEFWGMARNSEWNTDTCREEL